MNGDLTRQQFGVELRLLRETAVMTGRELGTRIGISQSKISRIESGTVLPNAEELRAWVGAVGKAEKAGVLLGWLTELKKDEFKVSRVSSADSPDQYLGVVRSRSYQPMMIPNILQTPPYASGALAMTTERQEDRHLASAIAARISAQQALYEATRFEFLVGEFALNWGPTSTASLVGQLHHLLTVACSPNIALGIVPMMRRPAVPFTAVAFRIHELRSDQEMRVHVDLPDSTHRLFGPTVFEKFQASWLLMSRSAWTGQDATDAIVRQIRALEEGDD